MDFLRDRGLKASCAISWANEGIRPRTACRYFSELPTDESIPATCELGILLPYKMVLKTAEMLARDQNRAVKTCMCRAHCGACTAMPETFGRDMSRSSEEKANVRQDLSRRRDRRRPGIECGRSCSYLGRHERSHVLGIEPDVRFSRGRRGIGNGIEQEW